MKNSVKRTPFFFFSILLAFMLIAVGTALAIVPRRAATVSKTQAAAVETVTQAATQMTATSDAAEADLAGTDSPAHMQGHVIVMVEMENAPASVAYAEAYRAALAQADAQRQYALTHPKDKAARAAVSRIEAQGVTISSTAAAAVVSQVKALDAAQQAIVPALTGGSIGGQVIFRTQRVYNGISLNVDASKISEISKLPGVKAVHLMTPKTPVAFQDVDFLGVRSFWTKTVPFGGVHGENVKVADIDSGLDFVHTDFGGNGNYTGVTDTNANGQFPSAKVPGGYDFAGDAYAYPGAPSPDPIPMDCGGHGTGTASLIGGYGVNFGGSTYFGNYDNSTNITGLKISPGMAPGVKLFPLRVFGCGGSTSLVTQAIEYAMDPNGDGNFSDHYDVINMSLGSNESYADDPDSVAASNAANAGVLVCSAAGNAGDTYFIHSSPAAGPGTLSVAASYNDQNGFIYDANVTVNTPPSIAGTKFYGLQSSPKNPIPSGGLTGGVIYANPADGGPAQASGPYSPYNNAAQMSGKICLVDRGGGVGFYQKSIRAQLSGAIGVIIVNQNNPGADPIIPSITPTTGDPAVTIPVMMISKTDGDILKGAAAFDPTTGVPANPTSVTLNNDNGSITHPPNAAGALAGPGSPDTVPSYTSRGPGLPNSALKPDLTAPAEVVGVAAVRTGNQVASFNGTSSATPHVSGLMAMMRQLHPTWTVEELNALAMNTATHDLFTAVPGGSPAPANIGVGRVGAGRVDATKESNANVVAFNSTDRTLVSVSFGDVEVPVDSSVALSKNILVENKGGSSVTYNVTYQPINVLTGASFSFGTTNFTVTAGGTSTIPVNFAATGNQLKHVLAPDVSPSQAVTGGTLGRQYLTEVAGYAVLTPTAGPEPVIRVPLYAAPKPVSSLHATISNLVPTATSGSFSIPISGAGISTGSSFPTDIISLVKALELQYASDRIGDPSAPTDANAIKYVGITSDYANRAAGSGKAATVMVFGIDGFGDAPVPEFNSSDREIYIDTHSGANSPDGNFDYVIFLSSRANGTAHSNVYRPTLVNLNTGSQTSLGFSTNIFSGASLDTNSFNNSITLVPVSAANLALLVGGTGQSIIHYLVVTYDRNGAEVEETPELTYNLGAPGIVESPTTNEPFLDQDAANSAIGVTYNGAAFQSNGSLGVLLLHMHNNSGNRSDTVALRKPTITGFSPTAAKVGAFVTITGSNFGPGTVVQFGGVTATNVNVISPNTISAQVPPGAQSGAIRVSNAAGASVRGGFTVLP